MSIDLGLARVTKLLSHLGNPHLSLKVLHVAGTNGKGSVCSYLTSVLQETKGDIGRFTSPHLCHVRDSITINQKPITANEYAKIKSQLTELNEAFDLKCTEFELMTVTALSYFHKTRCSWCVLEVGLGGRLDATNVIPGANKVCGITKIGLDHESFLGNDIASIAFEKAGIIVKDTPFVSVDGSNDEEALSVIEDQAKKFNARIQLTSPHTAVKSVDTKCWGRLMLDNLPLNGEYQVINVQVALQMLDYLQSTNSIELVADQVAQGLQNVQWPGRLQFIDYKFAPRKSVPVLFDGAHNGSAAIELSKYLNSEFRFTKDEPITFVLAITQGKNLEPLLAPILKPQDRVICTQFGSVEGMPWIKPMDANELSDRVRPFAENVVVQTDMYNILPTLAQSGPETKIVVCGSLYLVGQLLAVHYENI